MDKRLRRAMVVATAFLALNAGYAIYNTAGAVPQGASCSTGCGCKESGDCTGTGTCVCFPNPFCSSSGSCVFASEE